MANKKDLKKNINGICDALFADCIAIVLYGGKTDKANTDSLLSSVITIRDNYVRRISHPEPGMKPKAYYKDLIDKFKTQAIEVIEQIDSMIELPEDNNNL